MSMLIKIEKKPELQAMKKKAEQECENVAKYTLWKNVHYSLNWNKKMDIFSYYCYVK